MFSKVLCVTGGLIERIVIVFAVILEALIKGHITIVDHRASLYWV